MGPDMRRREFITLVGGVAVWPLGAHAQQGEHVCRIGILNPASADDAVWQARIGAFQQELALLGWNIGRNVRIDIRWATTDAAEIRRQAAELVALAPDVILSAGDSTVPPLLQATRAVPIVFPVVTDPVGAGEHRPQQLGLRQPAPLPPRPRPNACRRQRDRRAAPGPQLHARRFPTLDYQASVSP